MKVLRFRNEFETAEMVVRLEMANAKFTVVSRTAIMVDEDEPALVLPPTFIRLLVAQLTVRHIELVGVTKQGKRFVIRTTKMDVVMMGAFSVNDVMAKL